MATKDITQTTDLRIGNRLSEVFDQLQERIRDRAYHIFLERDPDQGDSVTDWLQAQLQLLTPIELVVQEQKKNIVVEANLEGFSPKEIEIEAGEQDLRVFGSHSESDSTEKDGVSESSSRTTHFYQAVPLPCAVDPDKTQAKLFKNGKLRITLPRQSPLK